VPATRAPRRPGVSPDERAHGEVRGRPGPSGTASTTCALGERIAWSAGASFVTSLVGLFRFARRDV